MLAAGEGLAYRNFFRKSRALPDHALIDLELKDPPEDFSRRDLLKLLKESGPERLKQIAAWAGFLQITLD
ncbi:MAG: hypothetical protein DCC75_12730 [Proteobacteria bacterium]|nr:MAG: hypothetical protein DCC75_12730 [Pseudomonadota bacterium]